MSVFDDASEAFVDLLSNCRIRYIPRDGDPIDDLPAIYRQRPESSEEAEVAVRGDRITMAVLESSLPRLPEQGDEVEAGGERYAVVDGHPNGHGIVELRVHRRGVL